jgi:hypothetical protein
VTCYEESNVQTLIDELGDIQDRRTVSINYTPNNRTPREKAVHRLVILGVIEDYTNDYAHSQINIQISGIDKEGILSNYLAYLQAYDARLAEISEAKTRDWIVYDHGEFVENLIRDLLSFIYNTVELGRRRSLAEMLQASTSGKIRQDILNYLQLGTYSETLASVMDRKESINTVLSQLLEQITSSNDAAELRGQTARLLESYPSNPALLFIRAFAEFLCNSHDEQVAFDNFDAASQFALSKDGWELPIEEVTAVVVQFAEAVDITAPGLGARVIDRFLAGASELRPAARLIITKSRPDMSFGAAEALLEILIDQLDDVLK